MDENLYTIIKDLISLQREGDYWDYKQEWYLKNSCLLHDIICLANSLHRGDRYLIIGVANNGDVVGVHNDTHRKKQHQLIDFIKTIDFAQDNRPEIDIRTLKIADKDIDVIIIKDKPFKPYYLNSEFIDKKIKSADIGHKYQDKNNIVRQYSIYTRIGDTNTPIDKQADQYDIEKMWRERFGLDLPPYERLINLLAEPNEWNRTKEHYHYHKLFPEFRIEYDEAVDMDAYSEPYSYFYPNSTGAYQNVRFYYHSTIMHEVMCIFCDECRIQLPVPSIRSLKNDVYFYYYLKDSFKGIFLAYLRHHPADYFGDQTLLPSPFDSGRGGYAPFLMFDNKTELDLFVAFCNDSNNSRVIGNLKFQDLMFHTTELDKNPYFKDQVIAISKVKAIYEYWISMRQ